MKRNHLYFLTALMTAAAAVGIPPAGATGPEERSTASRQASPPQLAWRSIGPKPISQPVDARDHGPFSGRMNAIAPSPSEPGVVYVGSFDGGVFKTSDNGATWRPVSDSVPKANVSAVAVDPNSSDRVLFGTYQIGIRFAEETALPGAGIYRSTDGGSSWTKVGGAVFDGCDVEQIRFVPGSSNDVLAGVINCENKGMWKSVDGGQTWSALPALQGVGVYDLDASVNTGGSQPTVVYFAATQRMGIWRSVDGGTTFVRLGDPAKTPCSGAQAGTLTTDPSVLPYSHGSHSSVATLPTFTALESLRVFAAIADTGSGAHCPAGVYGSADGGTTWSRNPTYPPDDYASAFADRIAVAIDPDKPSDVYTGSNLLQRYTFTPPATWSGGLVPQYETKNIHVDQNSLMWDNASPRGLWIANDGGVYRTTNRGETFDQMNNDLPAINFSGGMSGSSASRWWHPDDPVAENPGFLIGGTLDNGTVQSLAGSLGWKGVCYGDGGFSHVVSADPLLVYCTAQPGVDTDGQLHLGLTRLTMAPDRVLEWVGPGIGPPNVDTDLWITFPFAVSPTDPSVVYAGSTRLWKAVNPTRTNWSNVGPNETPTGPRTEISAIGLTRASPQTIYIGRNGTGCVQVSHDGGTSWIDGPCLGGMVSSFAVDPTNAQTAWLTVARTTGGPHVYRTTDGGRNWDSIGTGFPDTAAWSIAIDHATGVAYVGTVTGVYGLAPDGNMWQRLSDGLPPSVVTSVLIDRSRTGGSRLVAATWGRSAFAATLDAPPAASSIPRLAATSSSPGGGAFTLEWDSGSDPEGTVVTHTLQRSSSSTPRAYSDVATVGTATTHTFTSDQPEASGTWVYRVKTTDGAGYHSFSEPSQPIQVGEGDGGAGEQGSGARTIVLSLRKHLVASGRVVADADTCRIGAGVIVQRRASGRWRAAGSMTAADDGSFRGRLRDRPGLYRARAAAGPGNCAKTRSATVRHRH